MRLCCVMAMAFVLRTAVCHVAVQLAAAACVSGDSLDLDILATLGQLAVWVTHLLVVDLKAVLKHAHIFLAAGHRLGSRTACCCSNSMAAATTSGLDELAGGRLNCMCSTQSRCICMSLDDTPKQPGCTGDLTQHVNLVAMPSSQVWVNLLQLCSG